MEEADGESEEMMNEDDESEGYGLDESSEESEFGIGPSNKDRKRMSQWEVGVKHCFQLICEGKRDEAVAFDTELSKIKLGYLPNPASFLQLAASCEGFQESHAAHTPQSIEALLHWAKAQPADSWPGARPHVFDLLGVGRGPSLPDGVSKDLYQKLLEVRATYLTECLVAQMTGGQPPPDGRLGATMDWTKIEEVLLKNLENAQAHAFSIRSKPLHASASIALYSPEIPEALSVLPAYGRAILGCCLNSRQRTWCRSGESGFAAPHELHARGISHMDLGGDIIAFWGNRDVDEIRSEDWVLGYTRIAASMGGDMSGRSGLPVPKRSWISGLLVESGIQVGVDRVWAGDSRHRRIWAVDVNSEHNLLELTLPNTCTEGPVGMARFGVRLLAVAGTPEVFAWSVDESTFQPAAAPPAKRSKKTRRKPTSSAIPRSTLRFQNAFPLRQCEKLSPSLCLLAASEGGEEGEYESANHASMHIVDVEAQKTVALLCGHRSAPSLSRQLCADSHNLVFSVDSGGLALAFDVRTSLPVLQLRGISSSASFEQNFGILGVPVGPSCVAFTHASDECIRAWDIRSGATSSHAWTVSTGNLNIKGLAWHAPSSSLFACNYSDHRMSYGRYGAYGYDGDDFSFGEGSMIDDDGWPRKPFRPKSFFPQAYHAEEDCLLRYVFDRPRVASLFDLCAKSLCTLDGVLDSLRPMVCSARAVYRTKAL